MKFRPGLRLVSLLSAIALLSACGSGMLDATRPGVVTVSGGGGGGGSSIVYTGVLGDSLSHGIVSFTVTSTLSVRGTVTFSGASPITVTGVVDTTNPPELHASGSSYTFTAFYGDPVLGTVTGVYAGPSLPGYFVAANDSIAGQTHALYCGTYTSTNSNGKMVFQVMSGGAFTGYAIQSTGNAASHSLSGTVVNNVQMSGTTDTQLPFSGTMSTDQSSITGNYAPPVAGATGVNNATGTFLVTKGGC